jgi:Zn-dependent peptidase ImmA (M78 family)
MRARFEFARRMARKYLKKHRIRCPPVPVEYILVAEAISVSLVDYEDDTSGESWWEGELACIAVNGAQPRARLRFTLAHEFGHLALRHHEHRVRGLLLETMRLSDVGDPSSEVDDAIELEANRFAAELLMPGEMVRADLNRGAGAWRLAERYEVSQEAVRRRLCDLAGS